MPSHRLFTLFNFNTERLWYSMITMGTGAEWLSPLRNLREGAHFNLCTEYTNLEFLQQCILSRSL